MQGLSIVISDSDVELSSIIEELRIQTAWPMESFQLAMRTETDPIFTLQVDSAEEAKRYLACFTIKRAIVSINNQRSCHGADFDWMRCSLRTLNKPKPKPVLSVVPLQEPMFKECPFREIGYR